MKDEVKNWVRFAEDDLEVAKIALKEGYYSHACFNAQQCVEKLFKAILIHKDVRYPKSHNLIELYKIVDESGFKNVRDQILFLDKFYKPTRYPDTLPGTLPEGLPGQSHAERAIELGTKVYEISMNILNKAVDYS